MIFPLRTKHYDVASLTNWGFRVNAPVFNRFAAGIDATFGDVASAEPGTETWAQILAQNAAQRVGGCDLKIDVTDSASTHGFNLLEKALASRSGEPPCLKCQHSGRPNSFHCDTCNVCLHVSFRDNHRCVPGFGDTKCDVCSLPMNVQTRPIVVARCGDMFHGDCFRLMSHALSECTTCKKSMFQRAPLDKCHKDLVRAVVRDRSQLFGASTESQCNECGNEFVGKQHVLGVCCTKCGSYNTVYDGSSRHTYPWVG